MLEGQLEIYKNGCVVYWKIEVKMLLMQPKKINRKANWTYVVLKSAQLLLEEDVEEEACPGAGGGVVIGC